jgi:hypothetical protein
VFGLALDMNKTDSERLKTVKVYCIFSEGRFKLSISGSHQYKADCEPLPQRVTLQAQLAGSSFSPIVLMRSVQTAPCVHLG